MAGIRDVRSGENARMNLSTIRLEEFLAVFFWVDSTALGLTPAKSNRRSLQSGPDEQDCAKEPPTYEKPSRLIQSVRSVSGS